jgi:hypothetical protein
MAWCFEAEAPGDGNDRQSRQEYDRSESRMKLHGCSKGQQDGAGAGPLVAIGAVIRETATAKMNRAMSLRTMGVSQFA